MQNTRTTDAAEVINLGARETVASLDVDAQNCFTPLCPDELPVPEGEQIVSELNRQAELAYVRVGSKDAHPPQAIWEATEEAMPLTPVDGINVDVRWPRHGVPGTFGFESLAGLPSVNDYDYFVWKGVEPDMHPYGCCFHDLGDRLSTGIIEFLKSQKIETVLVGGLALDYCVKVSALQLVKAGFRVIVNQGATRGLAPESVEQALVEMTEAGVQIVNNVELLQVS